MAESMNKLLERIDAEFAQSEKKIEKLREEKVEAEQEREGGLKLFEKICEGLKEVWRPRLEALRQKFGEKVKVSPQTGASRRSATFEFMSELARITVTFSASTDQEVRNLVLDYKLEILPILMSFKGQDRLEQPLSQVNSAALGKWMEDRIVDFVKTYLTLTENEYYLKPHMVEDPVTHIRFPKFAAAASLDRDGKTLYFISKETQDRYQRENPKAELKAPPAA